MDYLLEQYELYDAYDDIILEKLNPDTMYNEIYEMYTEASTGVTKGNIFNKIVKFIIKAGQWIWEKLGLLLTNIKKFFSKVKNTADSIMDEMKVNFNIKPIKLPKLPNLIKLESLKEGDKDLDIKIENMFSPIQVKIDKNNKVKFKFVKAGKFLLQEFYKVKGNFFAPSIDANYIKFAFILKTDFYNDLFSAIENFSIDKQKDFVNVFDKYLNAQLDVDLTQEMSLEDFNLMRNNIDRMVKGMEKFDDLKIDYSKLEKATVDKLNMLQQMIINLQSYVNTLIIVIQKRYYIGLSYFGSVKDDETLSKIVQRMEESNFPMDAIISNILILTGFKEGINVKYGMGRLVFLHKDDVKKIAYNTFGIKSNKNEIKVSEANIPDLPIAKVKSHTSNSYILTMEKVKITSNKFSIDELLKIRKEIKEKNYFKSVSIEDFHAGNVIKTKDGYKIIDYGYLLLRGGSLDDI